MRFLQLWRHGQDIWYQGFDVVGDSDVRFTLNTEQERQGGQPVYLLLLLLTRLHLDVEDVLRQLLVVGDDRLCPQHVSLCLMHLWVCHGCHILLLDLADFRASADRPLKKEAEYANAENNYDDDESMFVVY